MADNIIKKPTPQEMAAAKLRETYVRAERAIIREITRKRNLGLVDYEDVASLKRVQEILTRMTTEADEYVPKMIESYFYTAEQIASAAGGYSNAMSLTVAQTSIVEQLVNNLLADIDEAAQTAFKSAENYLNVGRKEDDLFRKLALELTANKEAGVASRQTVQNMMAAELNAKGVTAFVDKAGREWSLESYCSMATRTTGRQAQVAAALTADDWDLWEIVKIGSTCPLCSAYEGRVYSKSGTDPDYPPLAMAFGKIDPAGSNDLSNTWLNLHPNCLHSLVRYTTAGKSEKQIERMKEFSSFEKRPADVDYRSKKQIEAYRNKEAERARYRADVKQFEKYKAAGVENMPVNFETFEKHKRAGDDVYKGWESKFRSMSAKVEKMAMPYSPDEPFRKLQPLKLTKEQRSELVGYAEERGMKVHNIRKFFGDPELFKEEIDVLEQLKRDFGYDKPIKIGFKNTTANDFGELNKKGRIMFNSYALIDKELTDLAITGQEGLITLASENLKGISAHEFGHLLQMQMKRDCSLEIAQKACYNIGEKVKDDDLMNLLRDKVSTYAFLYSDQYGNPSELLPEILGKHYTSPDSFTSEFIRLFREEALL